MFNKTGITKSKLQTLLSEAHSGNHHSSALNALAEEYNEDSDIIPWSNVLHELYKDKPNLYDLYDKEQVEKSIHKRVLEVFVCSFDIVLTQYPLPFEYAATIDKIQKETQLEQQPRAQKVVDSSKKHVNDYKRGEVTYSQLSEYMDFERAVGGSSLRAPSDMPTFEVIKTAAHNYYLGHLHNCLSDVNERTKIFYGASNRPSEQPQYRYAQDIQTFFKEIQKAVTENSEDDQLKQFVNLGLRPPVSAPLPPQMSTYTTSAEEESAVEGIARGMKK